MFTKIFLFLLLTGSAFGMSISDDPAFKKIYQQKQNSEKITLMIYSTASCPQCSYMKQKVFKETEVEKFLNKYFVILKKDIQNDELPDGFEYFGIPTIFFIDKDGVSHGKFIGSSRAKPFLQELKKVIQKRDEK